MDMAVVRGSREYDFVGGYLAPRIPKSCFSHEMTNSLKEQGFSEVGISAKGLVLSHSVNSENSSEFSYVTFSECIKFFNAVTDFTV